MDVLVFDNQRGKFVDAEIIQAEYQDLPLKKQGWSFNWRTVFKNESSKTYILRAKRIAHSLEGAVQFAEIEGLLVMNLLELAPHNIGSNKKRYECVAGCLIAFGCYQAFKLENNYKGFLSFETKTKLRNWYRNQYGAEDALGNKMFIWPRNGINLIEKYLNRTK